MSQHASTSLASFIRAAELGSFAAAGKSLNISAAAVGQNIKRMEDAYGVKLFNRTTRSMSLTPEGSLLYERVRGPLRELNEIDRIFDESRGLVTGSLRITAPNWIGRVHILPLVAEFSALHPGLAFELDFSDLQRNLYSDPIDVAFRLTNLQDSTMIARRLVANEAITAASPAYLERHGEPRHPQDLDGHRRLAYRFQATGQEFVWRFMINGEETYYSGAPFITVNDAQSLCEAAASGLGIIQMGGLILSDYFERGLLKPIMTPFAFHLNDLYLMYPHKEHQPLRVRKFIEFVMERSAAKKRGEAAA